MWLTWSVYAKADTHRATRGDSHDPCARPGAVSGGLELVLPAVVLRRNLKGMR